jgi:beta-glucosidase
MAPTSEPTPVRDDRVRRLLEAMSLDEKASLTAGQDLWSLPAVERLGVPSVQVTDGPNGARGPAAPGPDAAPTTCVPCGSALGATWDRELVRTVGVVLGREARAQGCRVLLAPTVNIPRSPLAGRNFECYSEDPLLSGELAAAFVAGVQSQGVATTVKHFVCNDAEFERYTMSSAIDERTLREIYLVPFELAVRRGGALGVMTGYNRVNGTWCSEDTGLLRDILRGEWGFTGFVLTDWFAVASTAASMAAGVDLEMPGPPRAYGPAAAAGVRRGDLAESVLDARVRALLAVFAALGALDDAGRPPPPRPPEPERRAVAKQAAIAATVLLRNTGVLPLSDPLDRIAVLGPNAARGALMGGGSASVTPDHHQQILEALRHALGDAVEVVHEPGADHTRTTDPLPVRIECEFFAGTDASGEVVYRTTRRSTELFLFGSPDPSVPEPFSVRARASFTPEHSGPHVVGLTQAGRARLLLDGEVILDGFDPPAPAGSSFMGLGSMEMTRTVEFVAGRRAEVVIDYATTGARGPYAFRVGFRPCPPADLARRAVAAAATANVAVVVVGTSPEWESEGFDRDSLALPADQDDLVRSIAAVNPRTVVVVNSGAPVLMPWADDVAAVVQVWFGGQEMGPALAEVLTGAAEPGGRLAVTIPTRLEQTPAYSNFPGVADEIRYGEGLLVGYRWYEGRRLPVQFCFGHGLSYTTFAMGEPRLSSHHWSSGEELSVIVPVTNTGHRRGSEVVQCYVAPPKDAVFRPCKELKAFAKVVLDPGESADVTMTLGDRAFSYWDPGSATSNALLSRVPIYEMVPLHDETARDAGWRVQRGRHQLHLGRSSHDISRVLDVTVAE